MSRQGPTSLEQLRARQQDEHVNPRVLTPRQVAAALQCSLRTVERRIADGALPVVHIGRSVRIRVDDLDTYLTQGD